MGVRARVAEVAHLPNELHTIDMRGTHQGGSNLVLVHQSARDSKRIRI